jgi:hypothetical protein
MSFAATLGLVALVQIGMPRLFASPDNSATARVALWGGREIRHTHFRPRSLIAAKARKTPITARVYLRHGSLKPVEGCPNPAYL